MSSNATASPQPGPAVNQSAAAFNAMLAQIKQLLAHVQELARQEQERLAGLVAQRTAQLDERNAEMRLVFDEVDQGLFMVDLRLPSDRWSGFWNAFTHAVRNAVDHGLETPDERAAHGKPTARLALRAKRDGNELVIEIAG